jgi:hypothetical protein
MSKDVSLNKAKRESLWRDRLARQASSGQSIETFCRSEAVSTSGFYRWKAILGVKGDLAPVSRKPSLTTSSFIDLGALSATSAERLSAPCNGSRSSQDSIELRIELGGGIVLTIRRH